jgi:NAD(P)H-dependent FMN reductase
MTARLLVVHHSHGGSTGDLVDSLLTGACDPALDGSTEIIVRSAFEATPEDVLATDAIVIATAEHFGYMSGALKHFFEVIYHPCLDQTVGLPWALIVKAGNDGAGAATSVEHIVAGLKWKPIQPATIAVGDLSTVHLEQAQELGAVVAASLEAGIL